MAQPQAKAQDALTTLLASAASKRHGGFTYAGEVSPKEAFDYISTHGGILADVRTPPEWQAGMPDLSATSATLSAISWKQLPGYTLNPNFAQELAQVPGISPEAPIFFMCKGGGRSLEAAVTMTQQGYRYCFNVSGGFEGKIEQGQPGWRASQLPCKQG